MNKKNNDLLNRITKEEKQTAIHLLKDLTVKEIKELNLLTFDGVQSQTKRIRAKMEASTIYGALARMIALGIIDESELTNCLPERWKLYINENNR